MKRGTKQRQCDAQELLPARGAEYLARLVIFLRDQADSGDDNHQHNGSGTPDFGKCNGDENHHRALIGQKRGRPVDHAKP